MNQISESAKTVGIFKTPSNKKLIELFKSQRKNVFEIPLPEPKKTDLKNADLKLFENISTFDWIIFSDIWTVEIFLEILDRLEIDLFDLDQLRICSNGEAVADSLRFRQIHTDVIPPENSARAVFTAVSGYIFEERELSDLSFFVLKAKGDDSELANLLSENSSEVTELEIYEIENRNDSEFSKLKALIVGGAVDEIVFSSPEEVFNLYKIIGKKDFVRVLSEIEIHAVNEIAYQTLREFDVKIEK